MKFDTLVIERNVDGSQFDTFFKDWFSEMFQLNGDSNGSSIRRNVAVVKKGVGDQAEVRFAVYGAWVKSSKFTDLEAGSSGLFKQTLELDHEGMERV